MPNPLADSFAAACEVRPELEDYVYFDSGKWWTWQSDGSNGVWRESCEDTAERHLEAACLRVLPGCWWDKVAENEYAVCRVTDRGLNYEPIAAGDTLVSALLSAVAGLGANTKGQVR